MRRMGHPPTPSTFPTNPGNAPSWQDLLSGPQDSAIQNSFGGEDEAVLLPFCVIQPEICIAAAGAVIIVYGGAKIHEGIKDGTITLPPWIHLAKKPDTRQADAAWKRIQQICSQRGVQLDDNHRDRWHDKEVTKKGLKGFEELVKAGVDAFCPAE